ncbi:hypothetical protein MSMAC_0301 [Methanosarcina mazei C16]|uniref:Uncharacterized protein n=4 Tax=Methanosarcina mazei TaxID=2209 RepID=A0A0E3RFF5_METMZ|nr:hypothetical protein MSMAP_0299 [Methanosarcina mazei SarPi]AKB63492.1 hypothetical protein MSMAS_0296 [Methanosarcina mazei S-6]AKB66842.1 hypothetical protein MSMAL_0299 [Methanosarcina mazei LYC]AKB70191.1 hypothetical protein MSMAC_0301 [Methanosarcina mazei C16]
MRFCSTSIVSGRFFLPETYENPETNDGNIYILRDSLLVLNHTGPFNPLNACLKNQPGGLAQIATSFSLFRLFCV